MRRLGALVLVLAVAVGCGVNPERDASRIDGDDVPFELLAPPTTTPDTTTTTAPDTTAVQLWYVIDDGLIEVDRNLTPPVSVVRLLSTLGQGPTEGEQSIGITTYLPAAGGVDGVTLAGGIAKVELADTFVALPPELQRLALAQLVFTLTGRPGVGRVTFTVDGRATDVPRGDGTLTSGSVSRDSYPVPVRTGTEGRARE